MHAAGQSLPIHTRSRAFDCYKDSSVGTCGTIIFDENESGQIHIHKPAHMQSEPIWMVNQDRDDQDLIRTILAEAKIPNEVKFFETARELLDELDRAESAPFIVMSDVNLNGTDGFQLREAMLKRPNAKFHSVPFIFWSEHASPAQVKKAFDLRAHGFFIKDSSFSKWKETFIQIILYWKKS